MKPQVTKESLAQWIAELESQPHLSLREERYLAVMKYAEAAEAKLAELVPDESALADKHIEWLSTLQRPMFSDEDWEELTLYTWLAFRDSARVQRAEILRNIERAK